MSMPSWWVLAAYDTTPFDTWSPMEGIVMVASSGPRNMLGPALQYDVRDQEHSVFSTLQAPILASFAVDVDHPAEYGGFNTSVFPYNAYRSMATTSDISAVSIVYGYTDRNTGAIVPLLLRNHGRIQFLVAFVRKRCSSLSARPTLSALWKTASAHYKAGKLGKRPATPGFVPLSKRIRLQASKI